MPYDDHVRGLLNSRTARSAPFAFSPAQTADTFSLTSPRQYRSPSFSQWSESPSVYSRSRMSLDDSSSEFSGDDTTTSGHYHVRSDEQSELRTASVLQIRRDTASEVEISDSNSAYRDSYVDPLRDSSEDEHPTRTDGNIQGSRSDDTLSDAGILRPGQSDNSLSSAVSGDLAPDPRLSFLGPKTRLISKAPWEEDGTIAEEEAVSDSECPTDALSMFAGKLKGKGRSRSKTLSPVKAEKERRFLGGGWGRTSSDTRPSIDSSKRSMESSVASYLQTPISPRSGSFSEAARLVSRTPSIFSTSSGASSGQGAHSTFAGVRAAMNRNVSGGMSVNSYELDSRMESPSPSASPTTSSFVHPYANLELLSPGHDGEAPSRSNSSTTLTASTTSPYITPSSSSSSTTSPGQDDGSSSAKKAKRRPPQLSVTSLNRGPAIINPTKSPSALSTCFTPLSPPMSVSPAAMDDQIPGGMLGFPGSPAYNLISLEQAQQKARERSKSNAGSTQGPVSPRPREIPSKKSMGSLVGLGGGFSSMIAGGSPSPNPNWVEDGRARTVSAGSGLTRPRGYTASSIANQSTTSVNIVQGGGIENIPERSKADSSVNPSTATPEAAPGKTLKLKRSGFLKFFKDKANSSGGNPNISAPSTPIHVSHNSLEPPPVPRLPAQFQTVKSPCPPEAASRRDRLPPVVVSSPAGSRAQERAQSASDGSHTPIEERGGDHTANRANQEQMQHLESLDPQTAQNFNGLRLRPISSVFSGLPDDYLSNSPKTGSGFSNSGSRGSSESRAGDSSGFEDSSALSPVTPFFAHSQPASARSFTHKSRASSGSDAFSSSVDPRTPSSSGFPRSSTDSQSAATIAALREQIELIRKASNMQISELETQVRELKGELEATKCDRCGQHNTRPSEAGIINRPRARTGTGCRTALGSSYD